jgi:FSR family fosmidomycin resistance protein-like MFS transporter
MSLFAIGGNTGVAIGPTLTSSLVIAFGLSGGLFLVIPGLVLGALLLVTAPYLKSFVPERAQHADGPRNRGQPGALVLLVTVSTLRSIGYFGVFTFVPLYEVAQGGSKAHGTRLLTFVLAAGAAATLFAGPLADRIGRRPILFWSGALSVPLLVYYVLQGGITGVIAVMLFGALIISTFGVQIVMAQEYMPRNVALASGLCVGVPIGLGGASAVVLGAVADAIDLRTALLAAAAAPALGAILTLGLPPSRRTGAPEYVLPVYGTPLDAAPVEAP